MTAAARRNGDSRRLIERLPPVRGRLSENVALAPVTWFRVGGPADVIFRPADTEDLAQFLRERPRDVPVTVLGVGSNTLVRDGGIRGVVIRLGRGFAEVRIAGTAVEAGAAALDVNVALACRDAGVAGLEFLRGIPGTIGGALRMNAGAYGREIVDVICAAEAVDPDAGLHRLSKAELGLGYRRCRVPEGWIFTRAWLQGETGDPAAIAARMVEINDQREATQPVRSRTGGSTFANPPGAKAWELIDRAGCRGLRIGGAQVSEQHCNFLINTGSATAADLEALGEEVRRRVRECCGVTLEWEIRRLGEPAAAGGARP
jgi:UDP-N-acetylmuramate dehydrogenase